ncbi:MAG: S8 family serine peptidase [Chloroflexota bacterium]
MKKNQIHQILTFLILTALILALAMPLSAGLRRGALAAQMEDETAVSAQANPPAAKAGDISTASDAALAKFDGDLQELARAGGDETVTVRIVTIKPVKEWPDYIQAVPRAIPDELTGGTVWIGRVAAKYLPKLASLEFVGGAELVRQLGDVPRFRPEDNPPPAPSEEQRARLRELRDNPPAGQPASPAGTTGWWDVGPGHLSKAAWEKGFTGDGVRVADIDSGVDFCHPDLLGTWAVYDVTTSRNYTYGGVPNYLDYFDGWPIALSPISNYALLFDLWYNGDMTDINTFGYGLTKFADTRTAGVGDTLTFDGRTWTTTGTAAPGTKYHIGYHPDTSLEYYWWGERIGVLVVDETGDGVYETVYVDLNDNQDFSDDIPATKERPTACWDADLDGYNDLSGGLVYFIADGEHWPQGMDWWWNPAGLGMTPPGSGDLVAFMFDDPLGGAAAHGTLTAGNIVGQGRIDGDPSVWGGEARPAWKPTGVGGMIQGGGLEAKLIAIGDAYLNFEDSTETAWYFASFGMDGYGDTDDGAQITSNSYGSSGTDNDEWDNRSRLLTRLNTRTSYRGYDNTYGMRVAHLFSTGNGAPGYGTNAPPTGSSTISVGASTQMGSTGWDSISGPGQIVWGDIIPFSNRGPTAVGHLAPHVTADGAFAAGAVTSNAWGDGWTAWETWGGTSRSAPVAAGNLALIYDAWKQRTGSYPTWDVARNLIMGGASDQNYDILTQGAGIVNADKATDIAGGLDGLYVDPPFWYPGGYHSNSYLAFANILSPGDTDTKTFNLSNFSTHNIDFAVSDQELTALDSVEFDLTATASKESAYDFNRPDYLIDVSQYAPNGVIPAGTVLMTAELIQTFDEFDPQGDNVNSNNNLWRILWYSHTDLDADGKVYNDANSNGVVNAGEQESGEYVRFSYGYNSHTYRQVSVKDPLNPDRWKDGIYLGLQHRQRRNAEVPVSHLKIRVTFYGKQDVSWLSTSTPGGTTVTAGGTNTFQATVNVPANMPYGLYQAAIELSYGSEVTVIPVVLNVAFTGDLTNEVVTLGGNPATGTPYDNSFVTGPQDWTWRPESGDWRFFFLDQTATPDPGTYLIVKDEWDDVSPETDIDTIVLAPTAGAYINPMAPYNFNFGDFSVLDPATFGPYRLEEIGRSNYMYIGSGIWDFDTVSGANTEYVAAEMADAGLHEIMQHTVRYQGDQFAVPFTKTLTILDGPSASDLHYTNFFTDTITFNTTLPESKDLLVEVYGMSMARQDFTGLTIQQDPTNGDYCDFAAGGIYTYQTTLGANVSSFLAHVNVGSNDLDLFLLYDANHSGTFSCPAETIASSTNSAGTDDEVQVSFPDAGNYLVVIQGWSVSGGSGPFSWYWERTDLDNSIAIRNADLSISNSHPATFELYNVDPDACSDALAECNDGIMYVGYDDAPRLFSIPITVDYSGPDLESLSSKTVNTATALPGDTLTYTVSLINSSYDFDATGVTFTDTLPAEVTFDSIVSGGASYNAGTNQITWSGNIPKSVMGNIADATAGFVDISSSGTAITWTDDDEGHEEINLPWNFPWFGGEYSSVWVDANGELCFGDACSGGGLTYNDDRRIPSANVPNGRIAAFYEDMTGPDNASYYGAACSPDAVYTEYDTVNDRFIIQYNDWCSWNDEEVNTFEVILYPNGQVEVQYDSVPSAPPNIVYGSYPGVSPAGIENMDGSAGYVWSGTVADDSAWLYTPDTLSTHEIVYRVTVNNDVPDGTEISNTALVNNGLGRVTEIGPADTTISGANFETSTKSVDKTTAAPLEELEYTIVLTNTGSVDAASAVMTDVLPVHTTFVAASAGATYNAGQNAVTWQGPVTAGSHETITYTVTVDAGVPSGTVITNMAQVGDGLGSLWWTNEVETTILASGDLLFEKLADKTMVSKPDTVTFTLHLVNAGDTATTVTVTDTLPAGLTLVGTPFVVNGPGLVNIVGNGIVWTGTLQAGYLNTEVTIRYNARPADSVVACTPVTNTAVYTDDQGNSGQAEATTNVCGYLLYFPYVGR